MRSRRTKLSSPTSGSVKSSEGSTISNLSSKSKKKAAKKKAYTKEDMAKLFRVTQKPSPPTVVSLPSSFTTLDFVVKTGMTQARTQVAAMSDFQRLESTLRDFLGESKQQKAFHNDRRAKFVSNVKNSVIEILRQKMAKYELVLESVEEQKKKSQGSDYNDSFGILQTLSTNIIQAREKASALIDLLTSDAKVPSPDDIMLNQLQRVVFDKEGISKISGDSRAEARDQLARLVLALESGPEFYFSGYFNMMILGGTGTGKTTIAQVVGYIMQNLFILFNGKIINATASDFLSGYEGSTGNKTREFLYASIETVLFIDEAYGLATVTGAQDPRCAKTGEGSEGSSKKDAITEIVNFMDKFQSLYMIVVAGYKDLITHCLLPSNEGLSRRFLSTLQINLQSYSAADLGDILYSMSLNQLGNLKGVPTGMLDYEWAVIGDVLKPMKDAGVFKEEAGSAVNLATTLIQAVMINGQLFSAEKVRALTVEDRQLRMAIIEKAVNKFIVGQQVRVGFQVEWNVAKRRWIGQLK